MMEVGWVRVLFPWAQARQVSRTILWTYTDPSSQHFCFFLMAVHFVSFESGIGEEIGKRKTVGKLIL